MVDCNGAYLHPSHETHRKLKCTSPFCGRVDNIATGVTDTCSRCSSGMLPIDRIICLSCGREMYNDNCHWCEEPEKERVMLNLVICPGRLDEKGKLKMVCKEDCSHSVSHDRRNECDVYNESFCPPCVPVEPTNEPRDRRATQLFVIFNVLTGYCGPDFAGDKIDAAMADIEKEISEGGCAWAFKESKKEGSR